MSIFSTILKLHQDIYEATDGRLGHKMLGVPTLLLRTTGRKSGLERTSALIYIDDGKGNKVVVASNNGEAKPPAWLLNLKAKPNVEFQINRDCFQATAEVVEKDNPEYQRLWQQHNEHNADRYDQYQSMTERAIPLVRMVPKR